MSLASTFHTEVQRQLDKIAETQSQAIDAAAELFAECLLAERWIFLFGTGHSHMLAEELFYRAGGITRVRPVLHGPLMLHESAHASTQVERDLAVVDQLIDDYPIESGDVLLIASNSGRNPVPVEFAIRAANRGAKIIALVNAAHSAAFPSRHPDGKKLPELADVSIDNCGVVGDACVEAKEGLRIGAASTVTGATILQMIACRSVELALKRGWSAELLSSSNADKGEENDALIEGLKSQVKHL